MIGLGADVVLAGEQEGARLIGQAVQLGQRGLSSCN